MNSKITATLLDWMPGMKPGYGRIGMFIASAFLASCSGDEKSDMEVARMLTVDGDPISLPADISITDRRMDPLSTGDTVQLVREVWIEPHDGEGENCQPFGTTVPQRYTAEGPTDDAPLRLSAPDGTLEFLQSSVGKSFNFLVRWIANDSANEAHAVLLDSRRYGFTVVDGPASGAAPASSDDGPVVYVTLFDLDSRIDQMPVGSYAAASAVEDGDSACPSNLLVSPVRAGEDPSSLDRDGDGFSNLGELNLGLSLEDAANGREVPYSNTNPAGYENVKVVLGVSPTIPDMTPLPVTWAVDGEVELESDELDQSLMGKLVSSVDKKLPLRFAQDGTNFVAEVVFPPQSDNSASEQDLTLRVTSLLSDGQSFGCESESSSTSGLYSPGVAMLAGLSLISEQDVKTYVARCTVPINAQNPDFIASLTVGLTVSQDSSEQVRMASLPDGTGYPPPTQSQSISEVLAMLSPSFSAAINDPANSCNEVSTVLKNPESRLTVFAPNDGAFGALNQTDLDAVCEIIGRHVLVAQVATSAELIAAGGTVARTFAETAVAIEGTEISDLTVGGALVTDPDNFATNGIVHVVNGVVGAVSDLDPVAGSWNWTGEVLLDLE